jgi:hypothetical protein
MPEFDVRKGPGRQLNVAPKITQRAHLRKSDFEKHGYTDRCTGCSALLRGLHVQPHTDACRTRMEEALEGDIRIKSAKIRLQ